MPFLTTFQTLPVIFELLVMEGFLVQGITAISCIKRSHAPPDSQQLEPIRLNDLYHIFKANPKMGPRLKVQWEKIQFKDSGWKEIN